jgi:hypothetical protein
MLVLGMTFDNCKTHGYTNFLFLPSKSNIYDKDGKLVINGINKVCEKCMMDDEYNSLGRY